MLLQILYITFIFNLRLTLCKEQVVDVKKSLVWGPGLKPDHIVLPARYFFIHAVDESGKKFSSPTNAKFKVQIKGNSPHGKCRSNINIIDRGDGSNIVRYTIGDWCENVEIDVQYNNSHVAQSPYFIRNKVYSERCYCPQELNLWLLNNDCSDFSADKQIAWDLHSFKRVNFSAIRDNLLKRYNAPESISLCHYVVKNQEVWRKCYGKYTGFKMFMDATLSALARVVYLPDMEFYLNLGDWPLSKKGGQQRTSGPYPIFSWCGSDDTYDITLPTYDITESTIENMGRVMLDMLSVQKSEYPWETKEEKAFFRGRDSRRERLQLIDLARKYPDLINASITNFFFFRNEEDKYGPKVPHISFMDFFRYKYQLNIDGAVAAYRLPYLLAGGSLVFKQDSHYYEHFYSKLVAYKHFVPIKRDLSDVIEKITWAKENESRVKEIVSTARAFVEENLMPQHIYCYHMVLFKEWSTRLIAPVDVFPDMEKLNFSHTCTCKEKQLRDEL
ncbi:protein O-glucosyltransferase 2-like [Drosophila sulfurigaster albostrigata]|uniref:Protein O-glucosyltransferase 2-like n=1 Tax=Drosophila albomicans TaxID=7291 RepID=A0A6P8WVB5_DROAB|nr:protein O-glucosyltransferase 2-like [Drosophila albomicans]XP_060659304.1 protein O-glucosyltransferase 2-like [Drosophila nasuta]XP_062135955.1 protein O-glucosyltransferase 2-like [Drosophila sulfurigaster albostrigata]